MRVIRRPSSRHYLIRTHPTPFPTLSASIASHSFRHRFNPQLLSLSRFASLFGTRWLVHLWGNLTCTSSYPIIISIFTHTHIRTRARVSRWSSFSPPPPARTTSFSFLRGGIVSSAITCSGWIPFLCPSTLPLSISSPCRSSARFELGSKVSQRGYPCTNIFCDRCAC